MQGGAKGLCYNVLAIQHLPDDLDIEAREADPDLGFMACTMVLCSLSESPKGRVN